MKINAHKKWTQFDRRWKKNKGYHGFETKGCEIKNWSNLLRSIQMTHQIWNKGDCLLVFVCVGVGVCLKMALFLCRKTPDEAIRMHSKLVPNKSLHGKSITMRQDRKQLSSQPTSQQTKSDFIETSQSKSKCHYYEWHAYRMKTSDTIYDWE